jgi:ABC-2 type transport system ATP-binding protein
MKTETPALEVSGLCKNYPAFSLKSVSFSVPQGAVMGFIGRNGAGKSTTLKSLLGLVHPHGGQVRFFGKDFAANEQYIKENIGVVLGGIDFYPKKKVKTITEVTRRFYRCWDEEKYRHYLKLFSIDENKRVDQLSSGMRVKYLIALALSHDAKLLILDEPTSGLDPVSRDDLTALFSAVVADGTRSILFSTHITSDLEKCATHITYIRDGEILCSAEKSAFIAAFDHLRQGEAQLTLEEIMVRTERRGYDESAIV